MSEPSGGSERGKDFLRAIVEDDLASGRLQRVATRFPPEPNGYLHIGHAKAICVDFGIAQEHGGVCHLRYDDTNPTKEDQEYVDAIERDVRWLGFAPDRVLFASDYFPFMYQLAEKLVKNGKAYVCELTDEQIKEYRGTLGEPGRPSPQRDRSPDENLARLRQMKAGELPDGACVLRAKIDMAASNMKMRDPLLYRIRHAHHHRTGDTWCIYPMYDFAHPISDAIEGITHSFCTLEFENNRELYDWVIAETGVPPRPDMLAGKPLGLPPRQFEFARLVIEYTMMSKRKLLGLVQQGVVAGWDDPRMPTLAGLRRRGYTPEAIRSFCELVGVAKNNSTVDVGKLEYAVRDDLNRRAPRLLGVVRPLRMTLTNVDAPSELNAPLFPEEMGKAGTRVVPFDPVLFIEREDFREDPPDDWKRLAPGGVVRLRHAGLVRCDEVVRAGDEIVELRCSVVDESAGKPRGVIHWVSAARGVPCEVRLYDRLFTTPRPDAVEDVATVLNPRSLEVVADAIVEPHVAQVKGHVQLERVGYFIADSVDSTPDRLVLNRVITLRDAVRAGAGAGAGASSPAIEVEAPKAKSARAATRPAKKTRAEQWAIAQERSPELRAHYAQLQARGFSADEARTATTDLAEAEFCAGAIAWADEHAASLGVTPDAFVKAIARWFTNELAGALEGRDVGESNLRPGAFAQLVGLATAQRVSGPAAKDVLRIMLDTGEMAEDVIATRDLWLAPGGEDLGPIIAEVLGKHAAKVAEYRAGRTGLLGFFVGQVLKASGGKASPAAVNEQVAAALAAG